MYWALGERQTSGQMKATLELLDATGGKWENLIIIFLLLLG